MNSWCLCLCCRETSISIARLRVVETCMGKTKQKYLGFGNGNEMLCLFWSKSAVEGERLLESWPPMGVNRTLLHFSRCFIHM